jgi:hypothetical protein
VKFYRVALSGVSGTTLDFLKANLIFLTYFTSISSPIHNTPFSLYLTDGPIKW